MEETGDGASGVLDGGAGSLAGVVGGAGVAEGLDPEGTHGVDDLGKERGGGVGVEVDAVHALILRGMGLVLRRIWMGRVTEEDPTVRRGGRGVVGSLGGSVFLQYDFNAVLMLRFLVQVMRLHIV